MTQELYIDGVLVDIDERLSVSLNIKSNLLGDVSKIAANHTGNLCPGNQFLNHFRTAQIKIAIFKSQIFSRFL